MLVFDFGGGTLDVTIMEIAGMTFKVRTTFFFSRIFFPGDFFSYLNMFGVDLKASYISEVRATDGDMRLGLKLLVYTALSY
jgi:hypothetical protein